MSTPDPGRAGHDTIAAVATAVAPGQGGIAVIRLSGPQAMQVVQNITHFPGQQEWATHRVLYGHVLAADGVERLDEVLVLVMQAPRSFTAEDVVEIHCHGGVIAVQRVLSRVLEQPGVRRALPGEFSQRAVLNGRLDLTRAEAITDLVAARSQRAAQLAIAGMDGGIQRRIGALRERLLDQLSELEARVDFEEICPHWMGGPAAGAVTVREALLELVADGERGDALRSGCGWPWWGAPMRACCSIASAAVSARSSRTCLEPPGTCWSARSCWRRPITLLDTAGIRDH